jgi:hypothetical protein
MHQRERTQCTEEEAREYMNRANEFYRNKLTTHEDWHRALATTSLHPKNRDEMVEFIDLASVYALAEYLASLDGKTVRDWTKEY